MIKNKQLPDKDNLSKVLEIIIKKENKIISWRPEKYLY